MERDDRPAVAATFYSEAPLVAGEMPLDDGAAHHARVKRLHQGDAVRLTDGRGRVALGQLVAVDKKGATVLIESIDARVAPVPIHLRVPIGDRDRMLMLAEKATELGIATWQAVRFARSMSVSPRGEGESFAAKVRARMLSALEQSGGAWLPEQLTDASVDTIDVPPDAHKILLDMDGAPFLDHFRHGPVVVVFGPEGGFEPAERAALRADGWHAATLGETTLRFETAGIAAIAVARAGHAATEWRQRG